MKISLHKRLGFVHVRAGKLLRVALEHVVPLRGAGIEPPSVSLIAGPERKPQFAKDQVHCLAKPGDLAIEVIAVGTGKVIGHSYLSGEPIRCMRYVAGNDDPAVAVADASAHWWEDGTAVRADLGAANTPEGAIEVLFSMRAQQVDLVVFQLDELPDYVAAAKFVAEWLYATGDDNRSFVFGADVLGSVVGRGKLGKRPNAVLHVQRPGRVQEWSCTAFQSMLAFNITNAVPLEVTPLKISRDTPAEGGSPVASSP